MKELEQLIKEYLNEQKLMQVATVADGDPWICSVWQASDQSLNVYFFSSITRRHSQEIERDGRVACALALPQTPEDKPRGLQFEGVAERIIDSAEIKKAKSLYVDRVFDAETIEKFMNHRERPHHFYKVTPKKFVLFDVVNFSEDPRQEMSCRT